jgi:hypothetical protein
LRHRQRGFGRRSGFSTGQIAATPLEDLTILAGGGGDVAAFGMASRGFGWGGSGVRNGVNTGGGRSAIILSGTELIDAAVKAADLEGLVPAGEEEEQRAGATAVA